MQGNRAEERAYEILVQRGLYRWLAPTLLLMLGGSKPSLMPYSFMVGRPDSVEFTRKTAPRLLVPGHYQTARKTGEFRSVTIEQRRRARRRIRGVGR